jgi:hypothetical protein
VVVFCFFGLGLLSTGLLRVEGIYHRRQFYQRRLMSITFFALLYTKRIMAKRCILDIARLRPASPPAGRTRNTVPFKPVTRDADQPAYRQTVRSANRRLLT